MGFLCGLKIVAGNEIQQEQQKTPPTNARAPAYTHVGNEVKRNDCFKHNFKHPNSKKIEHVLQQDVCRVI